MGKNNYLTKILIMLLVFLVACSPINGNLQTTATPIATASPTHTPTTPPTKAPTAIPSQTSTATPHPLSQNELQKQLRESSADSDHLRARLLVTQKDLDDWRSGADVSNAFSVALCNNIIRTIELLEKSWDFRSRYSIPRYCYEKVTKELSEYTISALTNEGTSAEENKEFARLLVFGFENQDTVILPIGPDGLLRIVLAPEDTRFDRWRYSIQENYVAQKVPVNDFYESEDFQVVGEGHNSWTVIRLDGQGEVLSYLDRVDGDITAGSRNWIMPEAEISNSVDLVLEQLNTLISSETWAESSLSPELKDKWEAYAQGRSELEDYDEIQELSEFLALYNEIEILVLRQSDSAESKPILGLRDKNSTDDKKKIIPFAYSTDQGRKFLLSRNNLGESKALKLAPIIKGLRQEIGENPEFVDYIDSYGDHVLTAHSYFDTYPRVYFKFPIPDFEAQLINADKLSRRQVVLLKSAFEIFDTDSFEPLKTPMYSSQVTYAISQLEDIAGQAFPFESLVILDIQDLMGDKVFIALVIAHEIAHLLQPPGPNDDFFRCVYEIGDGTVPEELHEWTAQELVEAVQRLEIGTVHVELWLATQLGLGDWIGPSLVETIESRGVGGWDYCH